MPKGITPQLKAGKKRQILNNRDRDFEMTRLWVVEKKTYEEIGQMYGLTYNGAYSAVKRVLNIIQEDLKEAIVVDVRQEFHEQLAFAKSLRTAARDYLANTEGQLELSPRADEVSVVYYDPSDTDDRGKPKKKTDTLNVLLEKISGVFDADKVTIKHMDMRKFALDAINTADTCIDKFAKLYGEYTKEKENPADISTLLRAYEAKLRDKGFPEDEIPAAVEEYRLDLDTQSLDTIA